jgi:acyl-CoA dehydrogenase
MNINCTAELAEMRPLLRRFVTDQLEPLSRQIDATGVVAPQAMARLREQGYLGMRLSPEWGGGGLDLSTYCLVMEEVARSHRAYTLMLDTTSGLTPIAIERHGTDAQKRKYLAQLASGEWLASFALTEPDAGSDAAALSTRAVKVAGGWKIDGLKHYISAAHRAQVLMVLAVTDPALRARGGITAFLVDKGMPGMSVDRVDKTIGSDPIELGEVRFDACFVPDEAVLGQLGQGFAIAMGSLTSGRMGVSAACIGVADRLIELGVQYAKDRVTFGQPLSQRQSIQWMLADSATELAHARTMAYEVMRRLDAGEDVGSGPSMVKLFCSEMVGRVADRVVQIFGGSGLIRGVPVERFYRDVRHYRVGEGSSEIQRMMIARALFEA